MSGERLRREAQELAAKSQAEYEAAKFAQLRRDRDDLLAALETAMEWMQPGGPEYVRFEALIRRVKGTP